LAAAISYGPSCPKRDSFFFSMPEMNYF